jgi:aldehyde:ferredoxin oxidoreductase
MMECFENGLVSSEATGGLEFSWGDADLLVKVVGMIARREGVGDILAEGVDRMSQRFGAATAPFNLTVKGQELPSPTFDKNNDRTYYIRSRYIRYRYLYLDEW